MQLPRDLLTHPDDLDRRLAFADVLAADAPEVAAFVRLGVALARLAPGDPSAVILERRARAAYTGAAKRALYEPHRAWLGAPILHGGLVEGGRSDAADFVAHAQERFTTLPLRHMVLTDARPVLGRILSAPWLPRLRSLELPMTSLDDADARAIARAPLLSGLAWLGLPGNAIGVAGVEALAASPHLREVQVVDLSHNPAPSVDCEPLLDAGQVIGHLPNPFAEALAARFGWRPWIGRADGRAPSKLHTLVRGGP